MLIWYLSYQHTNVSVVCSSVPCKYFTVAAGPSILPKLSLSDYANTTLRLWLSSVSGLHQREQSPSANKGLRGFAESDEHDSVSHQDGGQFGRTPVWDVWVVHSQVSLSSPLLSSPLLSSLRLSLNSQMLSFSFPASTRVSSRRCSARAVKRWPWSVTSWPSPLCALSSACVGTLSAQKRSVFSHLLTRVLIATTSVLQSRWSLWSGSLMSLAAKHFLHSWQPFWFYPWYTKEFCDFK